VLFEKLLEHFKALDFHERTILFKLLGVLQLNHDVVIKLLLLFLQKIDVLHVLLRFFLFLFDFPQQMLVHLFLVPADLIQLLLPLKLPQIMQGHLLQKRSCKFLHLRREVLSSRIKILRF
jgi:hypothetical protein